MPAPASTGSFADELYEQLGPLAHADEEHGWALLHFLSAVGHPFQLIEDLARDSDLGPGWSALLDVDRCPAWALRWLGQFVGVTVPPQGGQDPAAWEADARQRIRNQEGQQRGTPAAIRAAAARYLTGTKTVILTERAGSAYRLAVRTLKSEVPQTDLALVNELTNPSFEVNDFTTGWGGAAGGTTRGRAAEFPRHGTYSFKWTDLIEADRTSGNVYITGPSIPCTPGQKVGARFAGRWPADGSGSAFRIQFLWTGGTPNSVNRDGPAAVANTYVDHAAAEVAPAGTTAVQVRFWVGLGASQLAVGDDIWADGFLVAFMEPHQTVVPDYGDGSFVGWRWEGAAHASRSERIPTRHVENAILEQKPAGIVLDYQAVNAGTYDFVAGAYASYDALDAANETYDDLVT